STVLHEVALDLYEGNVLMLVGPNGAGKTTLLRSLNGSVPVCRGRIMLGDRSLSAMSRRQIARAIAVVAQENETRFPITVKEFVLSGRFVYGAMFGWESSDDLRAADDALDQCDLEALADRLMNSLSGGERQRVVLARALATGARILLLDEPTANLDLAHQAMMFRLVRERCKRHGVSAVVITHDLNLAAEFGDSVVMLKGGRVIAQGPPSLALSAANISDVFGVKVLVDRNPATENIRVTNIFSGSAAP
ncbi:MAG: ABC transporter ATP-binding protein, partial [Acidobacteria bacterium]|nr:ABC transporter ATP-binding protein [Acidobacteriota bacterium]